MNKNIFNETYLELIKDDQQTNIVSEEYHRRPLLGWNNEKFQKIILKMLGKAIKKYAIDQFDNYFLSDKLFSFKDVFKKGEYEENVAGNR